MTGHSWAHMDLAAIERRLRASKTGAVVTDGRLLRRIIKAHRDLPGLGLSVPHAGCYALGREALLKLIDPTLVGHTRESLPEKVILIARPQPSEMAGREPPDILARLWRSVFHAQVHLVVEERIARGALPDAVLRQRIDRIGQTEFDEVRNALRSDDRLLPPGNDREVYVEFAALYLELRHFAPRLLLTMFPSLPTTGAIDDVLALDVDAGPLLDGSFPEGAERAATIVRSPARSRSTTLFTSSSFTVGKDLPPKRPTVAGVHRLTTSADDARRKGNLVRSAILRLAAQGGAPDGGARVLAEARADLDALSARISAALAKNDAGTPGGAAASAWTSLLMMIAEQAAARHLLVYPIEARLLFDLQRAAIANERPERAVDVVTWALSLGKKPVVRPLPAMREVRVARYIHRAAKKVRRVRIASAERKLLSKLLRWATDRADENVRAALRPKIKDALDEVGLRPTNVPERTARGKLTEELLDQAVERGFFSIAPLRDAISKNQLKLENLSSARELIFGDALLKLDKSLATSLDGVYRGGELYLRFLQKVSSVSFGTNVGRFITLYAVLPFFASYVLLAFIGHTLEAVGFEHIDLTSWPLLISTTALIFGLLHSEVFRALCKRGASILGKGLAIVFLRVPRYILALPKVRGFFANPVTVLVLKKVLLPLVLAAAITLLTPLHEEHPAVAIGGTAAIFAVLAAVMISPLGTILEDAFLDRIGPTWKAVSRRLLPGLYRFIVELFRAMMDLMERVIYQVDEWLRYREGETRHAIIPKAAFGLVWFLIAYLIRLYITLLIEPEINPLKHFPVCTVSQKLFFATKDLRDPVGHALNEAFSSLGTVVGGAIAGFTFFFLPNVAGFLAWEFKENWKLYRASRPAAIVPTPIGHHGETLGGLLIPGFHAGTLPKLYARWRRAAQREDEASLGRDATGRERAPVAEGSQGEFREGIQEVEEVVSRFVEREFIALLLRAPRWTFGFIEVAAVELGSNRIRVRLACKKLDAALFEISFEEQSGLLVASVPKPGFVEKIPPESDGRRLFENALAGLYQLAGVDLVREQIEDALGKDTPYDVADEGLVAWPGQAYEVEVIYPLKDRDEGPMIKPIVRGAALPRPPHEIEEQRLVFRLQRISWTSWVRAWSAAEQEGAPIPRLVQGAPILLERPAEPIARTAV